MVCRRELHPPGRFPAAIREGAFPVEGDFVALPHKWQFCAIEPMVAARFTARRVKEDSRDAL